VIDDAYAFVVYGGEYSIFNALLVAADVMIEGGNTSAQYLQEEVRLFAIDLANAMATAHPPVNPASERLYFGKFIFENWEQPTPGVRIPLPNKFVPYVAARPRHQLPLPSTTVGHQPPTGSPSMNFQEKLANAFGHVKNARLLTQGRPIEDQGGHVHWALGQDPSIVKGAIRDDLQAALAYLFGDPIILVATNIFAYLKAARLVMQDPPITTAQESLEGHINWAVHQALSTVRNAANDEAGMLRKPAVIS
jgi:hypothetical protein